MLRATLVVLLGGLSWVLHPRVLAQERRFLLQIERSDAEDKGGEGKREGKKAMDETKRETAGARTAATESAFSCYLQRRRHRPSLAVPRAASGRCLSGSPTTIVR